MSDIQIKKVYLLQEDTLDEIFYDRNLAEVVEYLQNLTDKVSLDQVRISHDTYYNESDKISMWYERPETEEEKLYRESLEAVRQKERIDTYINTYQRSKQVLTEAGLIDLDTGSLINQEA